VVAVLAAACLLVRAHADVDLTGASRYVGMGDCGIAAADDAAAVDFNPANLGVMKLLPNMPGRYWDAPGNTLDTKLVGAQIIGTGSIAGDDNEGAGYVGAQIVDEVHKKHGFAIGWKEFSLPTGSVSGAPDLAPRDEEISLGYGHEYYYQHWSWGCSFVHNNIQRPELLIPAKTPGIPSIFNHRITDSLQAGGLFWFPQPHTSPIRVGVVLQDLLDNNGGPLVNLGALVPVSPTVALATDWNDVFGQVMESVNVGAEWAFQPAWRLRVGDQNLCQQAHTKDAPTAGVGWLFKKYRVDLAYVAPPASTDRWTMTGTYTF
jgi:hypothetical protein